MGEEHPTDPDDGRKRVKDQRGGGERARLAHRLTAVGGALAGQAAEQIEHAPAPGGDRVVGGKKLKVADCAGPPKRSEDDVVGVNGVAAAEKFLAFQRPAQWREVVAECRQPLVAVLDKFLDRHAETLFARLSEISLV